MLRCSPVAFAKCPDRALCGRIEDADFSEGSECDRFNQQVLFRPMSTFDKIRALDDEAMVDFIYRLVQMGDISGLYCVNREECLEAMDLDHDIPAERCRRCLLDWLNKNASEVLRK